MENLIFEQYLSAVCDFFPIHRLRKRIYKELSAHMQDLLEDFSAQGLEPQAAEAAVLAEMGDPVELRRELERAYRPTVWRIRIQRLAAVICLFFCYFYVIEPIGAEVKTYFYSAPLAEAEKQLTSAGAAVGEIEFLKEVEYNGRLYRYYVPEQQEKDCNRVYCMESVRVFGKELQNRFVFSGTIQSNGELLMDDLYFSYCSRNSASDTPSLFHWYADVPTEKAMVLIFTESTDVRYFHAQLRPENMNGFAQWDAPPCGETPYYEVNAAPDLVMVTYPQNTELGEMQYFDTDKNEANISKGTWWSSSTGIS